LGELCRLLEKVYNRRWSLTLAEKQDRSSLDLVFLICYNHAVLANIVNGVMIRSMLKLEVEFLGIARSLAKAKMASVLLPEDASYRKLLSVLAHKFPSLLGTVIVPDSFDLVPSYILNVEGRQVITDLDKPVQDGQRVLLMFAEAGG